jgi:ABC-type polysaccharide/polyol phosphate export permease
MNAVGPGVFARVKRVLAYHALVKYLVLKDLKVKSRGTYLSAAWTLLNPLLSLLIILSA